MPASPEDFDRDPVAAASGQSTQLGMGERLRSARKGRALSLDHVAEALHLDEAVVLALEEERVAQFQVAIDEYDKLPQIIDDFVASVEEMGPNPFKGF